MYSKKSYNEHTMHTPLHSDKNDVFFMEKGLGIQKWNPTQDVV